MCERTALILCSRGYWKGVFFQGEHASNTLKIDLKDDETNFALDIRDSAIVVSVYVLYLLLGFCLSLEAVVYVANLLTRL